MKVKALSLSRFTKPQVKGIILIVITQSRTEDIMENVIQTIASAGILASILTLTVMAVINSFK